VDVIAREPPVASGGRLAGAREDRCPGFFLLTAAIFCAQSTDG
jgi:hypothetical protein